ncbi:cytochrome c [Yoonia sp.]|uniref:c-type cytochrome n=1 Tax=Yoonia sp. TaxID=2212373 RepID=UPI0025D3CCF4|nr:cytochrome c [Yoonia sp.]
MRRISPAFIAAMTVMASATAAQSQGMSFGEFEYQNSCVACHGASGKGDGPVTDFLSGAVPPDLTVLQQNNGGVFPVAAVYDIIVGTDTASAHGTRDMPIWGNRFRQRVTESDDGNFSPLATERYVNARVLALTEYLASIQVP